MHLFLVPSLGEPEASDKNGEAAGQAGKNVPGLWLSAVCAVPLLDRPPDREVGRGGPAVASGLALQDR